MSYEGETSGDLLYRYRRVNTIMYTSYLGADHKSGELKGSIARPCRCAVQSRADCLPGPRPEFASVRGHVYQSCGTVPDNTRNLLLR